MLWDIEELSRVLAVCDTPEVRQRGGVLQRSGMDPIVIAGMQLPDDRVWADRCGLGRNIEDRLGRLDHDIITEEPWTVVHVNRGGMGGTEVPHVPGRPTQRTGAVKERAEIGHGVGHLVVLKQGGARPATGSIQT